MTASNTVHLLAARCVALRCVTLDLSARKALSHLRYVVVKKRVFNNALTTLETVETKTERELCPKGINIVNSLLVIVRAL